MVEAEKLAILRMQMRQEKEVEKMIHSELLKKEQEQKNKEKEEKERER
jgi:hypothetical protein